MWYKDEDDKYSHLYEFLNYPIGSPTRVVNRYEYTADMKVCDLGCGKAMLSTYFESYVGVDVSEYIIERNKKVKSGVYHHASLHDLSVLKGEKFDVAICTDVMEHIPPDNVRECLAGIRTVDAAKFAFAISCRPSTWLDKDGNNLHLTVWEPAKWESELQDCGFTIGQSWWSHTLLLIEAS